MHLIFIITVLVTQIFAQAVVHDPVNGALIGIQTANQKMFHTFMQLQMVQDAIMIKNNILEAESYYTYISNCSKHRGGLVGYYKDMAMNELTQMINADKFALEQQATTITGPNVVDDFMAAAQTAAIGAVKNAGNAANSTAGNVVSSFNRAYNNTTNYQVADANLAVQTWQQQQNVQNGQFAKNAAIAQTVGQQLQQSNANIAILMNATHDLRQKAAQGDLQDHDYEAVNTSINSINAQVGIEIHHMLNAQTTLLKTLLDSQSAAQALALQTAQDISAFKSQNAMQRLKYGANSNSILTELQRQPGK